MTIVVLVDHRKILHSRLHPNRLEYHQATLQQRQSRGASCVLVLGCQHLSECCQLMFALGSIWTPFQLSRLQSNEERKYWPVCTQQQSNGRGVIAFPQAYAI